MPRCYDMNTAYLTAFSALAGSVVGGVTTAVTTWIGLRSTARAGRLGAQYIRRQDLFRDFIVAASNAYSHALVSGEPQLQEIIALYAMVSRMRILCSNEMVSCADKIMRLTIDTYFEPNRTLAELRELIKNEADIDPLKEFSEVARAELEAFTS